MRFTSVFASVAAIGLATAPIAASAGTRAADAAPTVNTSSMELLTRSSRTPESKQELGGAGSWYAIAFLVGLAAMIYLVADDDDDRSPGT